ncbi:hypothetical protein ACRALDRAFT_2038769 [Sodiomyces alcalophilus JCM 7366]|uniref:uncharacterized protein n=1 Tax=Sodiomyces alcalophilus JCM 7366 TaxID=591952 RepID=UPI0039B62447
MASSDVRHQNGGVRPASPPPAHGVSDAVDAKHEKTECSQEPLPETPQTDRDSGSASSADTVEEFKEGGYGWVVVLCVFLINAHTWGLNSSYAVFLAYYLNSGAFPDADPITIAFVGGLSFSIALLVAPLVTTSVRLTSTRKALGFGVVTQTVALVAASFSTRMWHLLLSQGIAFGLGMGFNFNATVGIVPQWFHRRRSFASSLSTAGSGFGGLVYSLASNAMIDSVGLAWAFRILAILSFVVNGICCLLMRDRNKAVGSVLAAFRLDLFRRKEYLLFLSWGFFTLIGYVIVLFSLSDYAQSVGFSASQGSIIAAVLNLSQGIGRPLIGLASDRWGRINVCGIGTLLAALSTLFLWTFAGKHYPGTIVYALFGAFVGCIWPTVAPVGAEVVGLQMLPSALSIFWTILVLPTTFAQPIALAIKTPGPDGYRRVQLLAGFMYIGAFISIWLLRVWKLRELEKADLTAQERRAAEEDDDVVARATSRRSTKTSRPRMILRGFLSLSHV